MLLMNLESRPVVFEDVARQVLASGSRKPATYYIEAIERVTENDIQRVAARMLRSKPSVAALGTLKVIPISPNRGVGGQTVPRPSFRTRYPLLNTHVLFIHLSISLLPFRCRNFLITLTFAKL